MLPVQVRSQELLGEELSIFLTQLVAGTSFPIALDFAVEIRDVMACLPLLYCLHFIYLDTEGCADEMKRTRLVWRERGQVLGRKGYATFADFDEYLENKCGAGVVNQVPGVSIVRADPLGGGEKLLKLIHNSNLVVCYGIETEAVFQVLITMGFGVEGGVEGAKLATEVREMVAGGVKYFVVKNESERVLGGVEGVIEDNIVDGVGGAVPQVIKDAINAGAKTYTI